MPLQPDDATPPLVPSRTRHATGVSQARRTSRPVHSISCRRHQYRFLLSREESNMSTGDAIPAPSIPPLGSTRLHHRHQQQLHMPLRLRRNGALTSVYQTQSHLCRSVGALVQFSPRLLFQPLLLQARHSRRWRAGVLRALRPFRRLRDKQADPSEVIVKRPRLTPAQVMSATLLKSNEWSLGNDERGPSFDQISKDWRHSNFLTGRATAKEIRSAFESPENQRLLLAAMAREWMEREEPQGNH